MVTESLEKFIQSAVDSSLSIGDNQRFPTGPTRPSKQAKLCIPISKLVLFLVLAFLIDIKSEFQGRMGYNSTEREVSV